MTQPLWETPAPAAGPLRRILSGQIDAARQGGADLPDDLALIALSLADRIDYANAHHERRGFVMLTAEYRQARDQLFAGVGAGDGDGFDAALAEFVASTNL